MRQFQALLAILVFLALSGPFIWVPEAHSETAEGLALQVEELSAQGFTRFRNGDYRGAIVLFEEAYNIEPVPNLLYNIARCYEELGELETAVDYFQRYTRLPGVEDSDRQAAEDRISNLERKLADRQNETAQEIVDSSTLEVDESPSQLPAFAAMGGGIVLIGAGVAMGLAASSSAGQISDDSLGYNDRLAARDRARTQGIVADVFYVGGAAALGVGLYLFFAAGNDQAPQAQAARSQLTPWVSSENAGLTFLTRF